MRLEGTCRGIYRVLGGIYSGIYRMTVRGVKHLSVWPGLVAVPLRP